MQDISICDGAQCVMAMLVFCRQDWDNARVFCSGRPCKHVLETLCLAQVAIVMSHRGEGSVRPHLQSAEKDTDEGQEV